MTPYETGLDVAFSCKCRGPAGPYPCQPCMREGMKAAIAAAVLEATKPWTAEDQPLPEDEAIGAAHPARTGKHERYAEALRLVGAKRSKYALVDLVNWLLAEKDKFGPQHCGHNPHCIGEGEPDNRDPFGCCHCGTRQREQAASARGGK